MNKSLLTNIISCLILIFGYFVPFYGNLIFLIGLFALSGSITNWLAIHMIFEKIPFLYGSGIIQIHFEEIKLKIKKLIMNEFFNEKNISNVIKNKNNFLNSNTLVNDKNLDKVFESLKEAIIISSFGNMLKMVGGKEALNPLKEPITKKLKQVISNILNDDSMSLDDKNLNDKLKFTIDGIVQKRLDELSPQLIKEIIQEIIREHLGWLVVWGGIFGGFIGLFSSIIIEF